MIRVEIVSDIRLYREGLAEILDREGSISVCGIAYTVNNAIKEIKDNSPDVVILDMTMASSCDAINCIVSSYPKIKLVVLSVTEDEDTILSCAKAGVAGYLSREASIQELVYTVCGVVDGEIYCPRRIAASLFHKLKSLSNDKEVCTSTKPLKFDDSRAVFLTKREKQIASLISDGLSNKQIARSLTIEVSTVKNHVHNILNKMGVNNRVQAVTFLQNQFSSN